MSCVELYKTFLSHCILDDVALSVKYRDYHIQVCIVGGLARWAELRCVRIIMVIMIIMINDDSKCNNDDNSNYEYNDNDNNNNNNNNDRKVIIITILITIIMIIMIMMTLIIIVCVTKDAASICLSLLL